jgi:hypothetical protein
VPPTPRSRAGAKTSFAPGASVSISSAPAPPEIVAGAGEDARRAVDGRDEGTDQARLAYTGLSEHEDRRTSSPGGGAVDGREERFQLRVSFDQPHPHA